MKQLNELRLDAGYTIADIARLTGVDEVTACRWLCGNARLDPDQKQRLATVLGVDPWQLDDRPVIGVRRIDRLRGRLGGTGFRPTSN